MTEKKAITPTSKAGIGTGGINISIFDRNAKAKRYQVKRIHHKSYV